MKRRLPDYAADAVIHLILFVGVVLILIPLLYLVFTSFSTEKEILTRGFFIFPKVWTLSNYAFLFHYPAFLTAYKNALYIAAVGTAINVALTTLMAYGLSKPWLIGRRVLNFAVVFT